MSNYFKIVIAFLTYKAFSVLVAILFAFPFWSQHPAINSFELSALITIILSFPIIFYLSKKFKIPLQKHFQKLTLKQVITIILLGLGIMVLFPTYGTPLSYLNALKFYEFRVLLFKNETFSLLYFFTYVFFAPITEELFHRGIILNLFRKNLPVLYSIFFSSALYAVSHWEPEKIWYTFFYGMAFGWIYYKSNNLLASILTHITVNLIAFFTTMQTIPAESPYSLIYFILVIGAALFLFYIYRNIGRYFPIINQKLAKKPDNNTVMDYQYLK